jgi:hypothetical protein
MEPSTNWPFPVSNGIRNPVPVLKKQPKPPVDLSGYEEALF